MWLPEEYLAALAPGDSLTVSRKKAILAIKRMHDDCMRYKDNILAAVRHAYQERYEETEKTATKVTLPKPEKVPLPKTPAANTASAGPRRPAVRGKEVAPPAVKKTGAKRPVRPSRNKA